MRNDREFTMTEQLGAGAALVLAVLPIVICELLGV